MHRRCVRRPTPSPKRISVVVLNGNGIAGAAANTSYALAQKGYARQSAARGLPGECAREVGSGVPDADLLQQGERRSDSRGEDGRVCSTRPTRSPCRSGQLRAAHAVQRGHADRGRRAEPSRATLTPTALDRTPPREPPNVRPGKAETLPAVRAAARWKVGFPLQIPTVIERTSVIDSEVPFRVYKLDDRKTVRFTFRTGSNEYWGIQETDWDRRACTRRQEPQRGHQGPAIRPLLQRPAPAHGRAPRRRRELLGREHAARLALERDDARDRQGPQAHSASRFSAA